MNAQEQQNDTQAQLDYLDNEAEAYGFDDISVLFAEEPELFDSLAVEWRKNPEFC